MDNAPLLAIATPRIQTDEGCKLHAYPDPLSGGDPWTVGYGATGAAIGPDTVWTQDEAHADLTARLAALCGRLDLEIPWWRNLDLVRQSVLLNMAYNLGVVGLLGFPHTLTAVRCGNYAAASSQMLMSRWAREVSDRATRLAAMMRTGISQ